MLLTTASLFSSESPGENSLTVRALLVYEGEHIDASGQGVKLSTQDIENLAAITNEGFKKRRARFFTSHEYAQKNVIGEIVGEVTAQVIAETPDDRASDLVGKMGIYGNVKIAGEDNVQAYHDGLIKEISVGLADERLAKVLGIPKGALYEVSAVGLPALAGAALFATTIEGTVQEKKVREELWQVWDVFTDTIHSIVRMEEPELNGQSKEALKAEAVEVFSDMLRELFPAPTGTESPPTVPLFKVADQTHKPEGEMPFTEEQGIKLQADLEAANATIAEMKKKEKVSAQFSALKDAAIKLRDGGKLTPAKFKELGFDDTEASITKFSAEGGDIELIKLEAQLQAIEEHVQPVKFGLQTDNDGLQGKPGDEAQEVEQAKKFAASRPLKNSWAT